MSQNHRRTPVEQLWPSQARRKRQAAERREREAVQLRKEAAALDAKWDEYVERRDAQQAAARNVERQDVPS